MYISCVPKYTFFHFRKCNKSHIHDKHLNFLFIIYITFDRKMQILHFKGKSDMQFCPLAVTYKDRITAGNLPYFSLKASF